MKRHATLAELLGEAPKRRSVGLGRAVPVPKEEVKEAEPESDEDPVDTSERNYLVKVHSTNYLVTHVHRTSILLQCAYTAIL